MKIHRRWMLTDPEVDVGSELVAARNMRSINRCSCVLQFTLRRAFSCDLHRTPSQVIHCIMLFFNDFQIKNPSFNKNQRLKIPSRGGEQN